MRAASGPLFRAVRRTAVFNIFGIGASSLGGVLLAVAMRSEIRGQYAAVQSWFWILHVLGELGVPAAVTYYVARQGAVAGFLQTGTRIVVLSGSLTAVAVAFLVPWLSRGQSDFEVGYWLMLGVLPWAMVGSVQLSTLQALSLKRFNRAILVQPALYLGGVIFLTITHRATLIAAMVLVVGTVLAQVMTTRLMIKRQRAPRAETVGQGTALVRYGIGNLLGTGPALVNTRLDQVVLSTFVALGQLGQYAIAVSISTLMLPVVGAIGQVILPHIASGKDSARLEDLAKRAIVGTPLIAGVLGGLLYVVARLATPRVLGASYSDVPRLVLLLLPGAIALASGNVLGDILRGLGRPYLTGWAQMCGAVLTVAGLVIFAPTFGVSAAALVSSVVYTLVWIIQIALVRRLLGAGQK